MSIITPTAAAEVATRLTQADRKIFKGAAAEVHPWMSDAEILQSIGCSFDVESCIPTVDGREYPESRLWLRSDNRDHLGTFGSRRQIIQPGDFVRYFRDFCDKSGKAISLDVVGTPDSGKTFYMASKLINSNLQGLIEENKGKHFQVQKDLDKEDRTDVWLIITDYYGESSAPKALIYFNELICYNGLTKRTETKLAGLTHLRRQGADDVAGTILAAVQEAEIYSKLKERLACTKVTDEFAQNTIKAFYRKPGQEDGSAVKKAERILEIYRNRLIGGENDTRRGTAWGILSAVTQHTTHGHIGDRPESGARAFKSLLDGPRAMESRRFADHLQACLAAV
jgi:hypothetical protein